LLSCAPRYGLLLGLLAAGYANYQFVRRTGAAGESFFAHVTAALTVDPLAERAVHPV
jgi:hypothetical protein